MRPTTEPSGDPAVACKLCGCDAHFVGVRRGASRPVDFRFHCCPNCFFVFVANPISDRALLYDDAYYRGQGADPLVDYVFELEHREDTIRQMEWQGVLRAVQSKVRLTKDSWWLDYGCGGGGLVRYCASKAGCHVLGVEDGWISEQARAAGIPVLGERELEDWEGRFGVVTAIEVLEHVERPLQTLSRIRRLLKPGGLFFYTTGNARPHRNRLLRWPYAIPEIHVSLFEPRTLELALSMAGFRPEYAGFLRGYEKIIAFKIFEEPEGAPPVEASPLATLVLDFASGGHPLRRHRPSGRMGRLGSPTSPFAPVCGRASSVRCPGFWLPGFCCLLPQRARA